MLSVLTPPQPWMCISQRAGHARMPDAGILLQLSGSFCGSLSSDPAKTIALPSVRTAPCRIVRSGRTTSHPLIRKESFLPDCATGQL